MKLRLGRNIRPRVEQRPAVRTVRQLTDEQADRLGMSAFYSSRDCSDGRGSVHKWRDLPEGTRTYWVDLAGCVATDLVFMLGLDIEV